MAELPKHYTPGRYSVRRQDVDSYVVLTPSRHDVVGARYTTAAAAQKRAADLNLVRKRLAKYA